MNKIESVGLRNVCTIAILLKKCRLLMSE